MVSLLQIALAEVGQREIAGAEHNPRIVEYHKATSLGASDDETPWCASFVNWVLQQDGVAGTNSAAARSFVNWGVESALEPGAVVVLRRGSQPWQGHVGFLSRVDAEYVYLIGGNQGNAVSSQRFKRSDVIAVRKPKSAAHSKTIAAAGVGGVASVLQLLTELEGAFGDLATRFDWAHYVLAGISVAAVAVVAYERIQRLRRTGV